MLTSDLVKGQCSQRFTLISEERVWRDKHFGTIFVKISQDILKIWPFVHGGRHFVNHCKPCQVTKLKNTDLQNSVQFLHLKI